MNNAWLIVGIGLIVYGFVSAQGNSTGTPNYDFIVGGCILSLYGMGVL